MAQPPRPKLYLVIEHYVHGPAPVYRRAAERGRMLPDGLRYLDSWVVDAPRAVLNRSLPPRWHRVVGARGLRPPNEPLWPRRSVGSEAHRRGR
jgi:hypothetical protein